MEMGNDVKEDKLHSKIKPFTDMLPSDLTGSFIKGFR